MVNCAEDIETLKDTAIRSFEERVKNINPDLCYEFNAEVDRLEAQTIQLYSLAALATRRLDDTADIARVWEVMVKVCDDVAKKIHGLCAEHPYCTASHDKILDLRNKCSRLRDLHA